MGVSVRALDLHAALPRLGERRPVFWSEADLQHELAIEISKASPQNRVRLEWPLPGSGIRAVDILVSNTAGLMAIELKYMTQSLDCEVAGEPFMLRPQGAQDTRRYDVFKDIARMEEFCAAHEGAQAAVVMITNDPRFWSAPGSKRETNCINFSLAEGRSATGSLAWGDRTGGGTKKKREASIVLTGQYEIAWNEYSDVGGKFGRFRAAIVDIGRRISADQKDYPVDP